MFRYLKIATPLCAAAIFAAACGNPSVEAARALKVEGNDAAAEAAREAGKGASICGEIAGDHWFTPLLVGLGYRELSMAPVFLPRVKLMLRSFSLAECRELAARALSMHATTAVRKLVHEEIQPRWAAQLGGSIRGDSGADARA